MYLSVDDIDGVEARPRKAGYPYDVISDEIASDSIGVDCELHDAIDDRREFGLLVGDIVRARFLRAEDCKTERSVGLRGFQVVAEQRHPSIGGDAR